MFEFETVYDVLSFAISLEHISQEFYIELLDQVDDESVKSFLRDMAAEEAKHEVQLRELVESGEELKLATVPVEEIDAYIEALKVPDDLDYKKAVKIARDKENASRMLYTILAGLMSDKEIKDMLLYLADQEQKHKEFFEKEYQRI
ncbi:MAG: ferritin family protein, partial [Planctomycetota bacterium]